MVKAGGSSQSKGRGSPVSDDGRGWPASHGAKSIVMVEQRPLNLGREVGLFGLTLLGSVLAMKWLVGQIDPNKGAKSQAKKREKELYARLGRKIHLVGYEHNIALDVVIPDQISTGLADIGGLDHIVSALTTRIIAPLQEPQLFKSRLLHLPRGVLLYGPPGTGKTMLAKALAKESGAVFLNIRASSIMSKWFGDSQKLVSAIFSLACKLQPSIIFIDEADALLGKRRDQDHEASTQMKTEFMQLWDGFLTDNNAAVLVLAATNRPSDLDDAVLRRFTHKFEVPLPGKLQREAILQLTLSKHAAEAPVDPALLGGGSVTTGYRPLEHIAAHCDSFSGSDLVELCSQAAAIPVHAQLAERRQHSANGGGEVYVGMLTAAHLETALESYKPTVQHVREYGERQTRSDVEMQRIFKLMMNYVASGPQEPLSEHESNGRRV